MRAHRQTIALFAVTVVVSLGAGCSSDGSSKPKQSIVKDRVSTGMKVAVERAAKTKVKPGTVACNVTLDDKTTLATYDCKATSVDGQPITMTGSSSYALIKNKKKKALDGSYEITVGTGVPLKVSCVGSGC